MLSILPVAQPEFTCPGENYRISRAVHLSRLAAYYPKCRDCPQRGDTGQLPQRTLDLLQKTERRVERASLFSQNGVRGIYLNELDRTRAGQFAGALASLLWEENPLIPRPESVRSRTGRLRPSGPAIVIGHDERPASPDIVTGVAIMLRRMGCHVIDVGLSTRPAFWFGVHHLQAAAGIHVTGSGCAPAWTGLDFVGGNVVPYSVDDRLPEIELRAREGFQRPLRQSAGQRTFRVQELYVAGLWKHFHALRPLRVSVGCPNRPVREVIERVFAKLACQLELVPIPVRDRNLTDPNDADAVRMRKHVRDRRSHLGILIDDDGQTCGLFDEQGTLVPAPLVTLMLADAHLAEDPGSHILIEQPAADVLAPIQLLGGIGATAGTTLGSVAQGMHTHTADLGGGTSGRYWFRENFPTCDAVLTTAKVLQALSRSDADFSEVAAAMGQMVTADESPVSSSEK